MNPTWAGGTSALRRGAGVLLIAAVVAPWWRLTDPSASDLLADTIRRSDRLLVTTWLQTGVLLLIAAGLTAALGRRVDTLVGVLGTALRRPRTWIYAFGVGLAGATYTAVISLMAWEGRPPLTDAWAQMVQARYLASGQLGAPLDIFNEFFIVANTLVTDAGWTAQYPLGHPALLSVGLLAGVPWIVGPLLVGGTAALLTLLGERLIPGDPVIGRLAGLFAAVGPLLPLVGAAYLSHAPAAFLTVLAAYAAVRASERGRWSVAAGAAAGAVFLVRPLTGVTIGLVAGIGAWMAAGGNDRRLRGAHKHIALAAIGAIPFIALGLWYNATLFGSAFEFGYTAYLGPGHAPGWHPNPWGHPYGVREAIAFTTADLVALGPYLLRTPLSGVFVIGLFLVTAKRLTPAARLAAVWTAIAVVNAAAYWHHDLLLGPRMLADAVPAWCLLLAIGGIGFVRQASDTRLMGPVTVRRLGTGVLVTAALYGILVGAARTVREVDRTFPPPPAAPESPGPALVFVHDSWGGRLAARLGAAGMRADSIAALLQATDRCVVHGFVEGAMDRAALRFRDGDHDQPEPPRSLTEACAREEYADRYGGLPLMPLLWQGDLPGLPPRGAMFVRDLGPEHNGRLLARHADRRPAMLIQRPPGPRPAIVPYETGIALLWSPADPADQDSVNSR